MRVRTTFTTQDADYASVWTALHLILDKTQPTDRRGMIDELLRQAEMQNSAELPFVIRAKACIREVAKAWLAANA